jgi:excisionase family DNA binding protein
VKARYAAALALEKERASEGGHFHSPARTPTKEEGAKPSQRPPCTTPPRERPFGLSLLGFLRDNRAYETEPGCRILTTVEVAELLRIHPSTLYKLLRQGQIPFLKIGSDYRFRKSSIEKWMADPELDELLQHNKNGPVIVLCNQCVHALRYADASTWKWSRDHRDRFKR